MAQPGHEERHGLRLVLALVAVLVVAAMALAAVLLNRGGDDATTLADDASTDAAAATADSDAVEDVEDAGPCPVAAGDLPSPTTTAYEAPPSVDLEGASTVRATISTTCGEIVVALDAAAAPATVGNFVALAEDGYYDGVGFHRVIDDFMIQGGDPTGTGTGCVDSSCSVQLPGYTFPDELGLAEELVADEGGYTRGTLAMANRGPDTNGSQFFIMQSATPYALPPAYAVFGEVVSGMEVVDRIALGPVEDQLAIDPVVILAVDVQR